MGTVSLGAAGDTVSGDVVLVFQATGAAKLSFDAMRVLRGNGVFIFTGVPGRKTPVEVDADLIMRNLVLKNQVVFGSVNAPRETSRPRSGPWASSFTFGQTQCGGS